MLKTIITSINIERTYAINSFLYNLKRLPIFNDLLTEDIYHSKFIKHFSKFLSTLYYLVKIIFLRLLYFYVIYLLAKFINHQYLMATFIHIYFIFTILGLFINNKLLNTSIQKYFSIILFKIDAKKYMKSTLIFDLFRSLLLNIISFSIFSKILNIPFFTCLILICISFLSRIVGEAFNIFYYKKYNYIWLNNYPLYFSILIGFLILASLPYFNIFIPQYWLTIISFLLLIIAFISIIYLLKIDDYKLMYKQLNTKNIVMNSAEAKSYSRQQMVEVKNKDIFIPPKKLRNKKGYDLFNTIFFERHREILLRSAKRYSLVLFIIYLLLIIITINNHAFGQDINNFLSKDLGWFVLIMYFINRGAIITQAMFFNCDHAMLNYNFYREPKTLLNIFKKRALTITKVNLLPAIIIGTGNIVLLSMTSKANTYVFLTMFLFIISLSIFFSIHYLVIYYLFQPYDKEMKMKKPIYSIISALTYVACYFLATSTISNVYTYSILGITFTLVYTLIALVLVYKFSPKTFKID